MKRTLFLMLFIVISLTSAQAQNRQIKSAEKPVKSNAKEDGGAEMKTYVMVFLVAGENRNQEKEEVAKIQKEHLEHLGAMHEDGLLLMAGPFKDKHDIKGILIMNASEIDEVKEKVEQDPAIIAGRLKAEYHLWYTQSGTVVLP